MGHAMQQTLTLDPTLATAIHLHQTGDLAGAQALYRQILAANPDQFDALHLLGVSESQLGRNDAAIELIRRALMIRPDHAEAHANLGTALVDLGRPDEAIDSYRRAVALRPDLAGLHYNLAGVLRVGERLDEAAASYRRAIALQPNFVQAHNNLGSILQDQLRLDEAIACFRDALALQPSHASAADNLIFAVDLHPATDPAAALAERQRWCKQNAEPFAGAAVAHDHVPDAERRLRIGYVSADFRRHSAADLFAAIVPSHSSAVEVYCYSSGEQVDDMTAQLRAGVAKWRDVARLSDDGLAQLIRADRVDILVDLSGFTGGNRLRVFARRPAPIQVQAWGYPLGSGMKAMDYLLADKVMIPDADRPYFSEEIVHLPAGFAYAPPTDAPECVPLPALAGRPFTFGSFNRVSKLSDAMLQAWGEILERVPNARLLIKDRALDDPEARQRLSQALVSRGVAAERIELRGQTTRPAHMAAFADVDLALDSFPQNGGITAIEGLWMGVPMVTLVGKRPPGRVGASLLAVLDLDEFVAQSADEYVTRAVAWTARLDALAALRASLRQRLRTSIICNHAAYTQAVEAAYRMMWRRWCAAAATRPKPSAYAPPPTLRDELMRLAALRHKAGQLTRVDDVCAAVIDHWPLHAPAVSLMGGSQSR